MALLLFGGCVNLTPPWDRAGGQGGAAVDGATDPAVTGSGGWSGGRDAIPPMDSAAGGSGGVVDVPSVDGSPVGGSGGSIDSPLVETEAGGAGGRTVDADIDVPMGGAGGAAPDGALDEDVRGTGGSGTGGKGTGRRSGTGGSGTGGKGTGGSGTGGRGTGGSGTGGRGTGGSGTGGSGTGGSGTGGRGTGGSTDVVAGLVVYYKCDETTGSTLTDSSGNGRNGTLVTGTGGSGGYSFKTGKVNNALFLVKSSQGHASLPQGTLSGATEMTIATWVYVNNRADWQRVWDFGNNNTNVYMYLTPRSDFGFLRFAITASGKAGEQGLEDDAELPVGGWHHLAVVLGSGAGVLYLDGKVVTTNSEVTLRPANLGSLSNIYIGRSQWPNDPYFDGNVDDFRVYDRALTAGEIQTLFTYTGS